MAKRLDISLFIVPACAHVLKGTLRASSLLKRKISQPFGTLFSKTARDIFLFIVSACAHVLKGTLRLSLLLTFIIASHSVFAEEISKCVDNQELMNQAVVIQNQGKGKGSGILYNPTTVLTNKHVINNIDKVWVYIPRLQKSISATVIYSLVPPDIAVLKLSTPIPETHFLEVEDNLTEGQKLTLISMPFAKPHLIGAVTGIYNYPVKLQNAPKGKPQNMNISLSDWAFSGDSGGAYFTCDGLLAGIHFGNQAHKNKPKNAFAVNGLGVNLALKKAGIE